MLYLNEVILGSLRKIQDPRGSRTPNHWVMYSYPEEDSVMPFITLRQISITMQPAGLGLFAGIQKSISTEEFVYDGVNRKFKLSNPAIQILTVDDNNYGPCPWTYPDYYRLDLATNEVVVDSSAKMTNGDLVTVVYTHEPDSQEMIGYRVDATYNITVYSKKNSQGKDDEIFDISGTKYANGKLVDYLFMQVYEGLVRDYSWFRKRGILMKIINVSEEVYDPDTRRFAKQIQISTITDALVCGNTTSDLCGMDRYIPIGLIRYNIGLIQ